MKKSFNSISIYTKAFLIFIYFYFITFQSFSQENIKSISPPYRSVKELKYLTTQKGDSTAYYELHFVFKPHELLPYALLMINKYDYINAYFDVYYSLINFYEINKIDLDKNALDFALSYLMKGAELGCHNCMFHLGFLYLDGKYVEKDTIKGQELIIKSGFQKSFDNKE